MIELTEDQERLIAGIRASMTGGNRWVLAQAATGSGKSYVASSIIHGSRKKGARCMITVPRKELVAQMAQTFREFDIPFGYVAGGYDENPLAQTFIATTQTLARRIATGNAPYVDLLIPDETHFGGAMLGGVIDYYKAAGARGIGLSATPLRMDGTGLGIWYDDMVEGEPVEWLIAHNRLSGYRLFEPATIDRSKLKKRAGEFTETSVRDYLRDNRHIVGSAIEFWKKYAAGKLTVAFCCSVEESEATAQRFRDAGIPAASIDGDMGPNERRKIIQAFARREIVVLCNNILLTFGFDLRTASGGMDVCIEAMIDVAPTTSLPQQMQKWGRVLRWKPEAAVIIDQVGNRFEHGYPDDPRDWSLDGVKKGASSRSCGVAVRRCSGGWSLGPGEGEKLLPCYFSHRPAPRCPNCGAWYDVQSRVLSEVEGELGEATERYIRRPFTNEERREMIDVADRITFNAVRKGMPRHAARSWALKKAMAQMIEKVNRGD